MVMIWSVVDRQSITSHALIRFRKQTTEDELGVHFVGGIQNDCSGCCSVSQIATINRCRQVVNFSGHSLVSSDTIPSLPAVFFVNSRRFSLQSRPLSGKSVSKLNIDSSSLLTSYPSLVEFFCTLIRGHSFALQFTLSHLISTVLS